MVPLNERSSPGRSVRNPTPTQIADRKPEMEEGGRYGVNQVRDSMKVALDSIAQSGATDQMRGYANEAMGKTKLSLGLATRSPNLTLTGLAQVVVGEFQKSVGAAKLAEDDDDLSTLL